MDLLLQAAKVLEEDDNSDRTLSDSARGKCSLYFTNLITKLASAYFQMSS